jgi:PilZ domain
MENRRTQTRYDVSLAGVLEMEGNRIECNVENLSLGGALVGHPRVAMGLRCKLTFSVPTQPEVIEIGATVRWSTDTSIGLQFDGLRAREVYSIGKYLEQLAA